MDIRASSIFWVVIPTFLWFLSLRAHSFESESRAALQGFRMPTHSVYDVISSYCSAYNRDVTNRGVLVNKTSPKPPRWKPRLDLHNPCAAPTCVLDLSEGHSISERLENSTTNATKHSRTVKRIKVEDIRPVLRLDKRILNGAGCDAVSGNSSNDGEPFGGGICVQGHCKQLLPTLSSGGILNSIHQLRKEGKSAPRYLWQRVDDLPCSLSCSKSSSNSSMFLHSSIYPGSGVLRVAVQCINSANSHQVEETLCDSKSRDATESVPCVLCPTLNYPTSWSPDDVSNYPTDDVISETFIHGNFLRDLNDRIAAGPPETGAPATGQLADGQLADSLLATGQLADSSRAAGLERSAGHTSAAGANQADYDYPWANHHDMVREEYANSLDVMRNRRRNEVAALTDRGSDYIDKYKVHNFEEVPLGSLRHPNVLPPPGGMEQEMDEPRDLLPDYTSLWRDRQKLGPRREQSYMALKAGQKGEESKEISTVPGFYTSGWGPCSVTCSTGIRTRRVICRVFVESNNSVVNLLDSNCAGEKPSESDICTEPDCIGYITQDTYTWSITGYGPCSRSCAGGLQNPVYSCLRDGDQAAVKSTSCAKLPLPQGQPRLCNEQRCPPRWRVIPDGGCSAPCGGGQQKRLVKCMLDAMDAGGESLVLSNSDCQATGQRPPPKTVLCNMAPCPPNWFIDGWSQCTVTCGVGVRQRKVRCEQKVSLSTVLTINDLICLREDPKPETEQLCDLSHIPCPSSGGSSSGEDPVIHPESLSVVQLRSSEKILLNAGSSATVIPGVKIQLYCPVKRGFNRRLIQWTIDGKSVPDRGRIRTNKKGVVRVRRSRVKDAGIYTCSAGGETANVTLMFHSSRAAEELIQQRRKRLAEMGVDDLSWLETGEHVGKNDGKQSDQAVGQRKPFSYKLLSKSNSEALHIHYLPTEWTPCSQTCGGSGYQSRDIACHVIEPDYTLLVDDELCDRRGLIKPLESRDCGLEACPQWKLGQWGECDTKVCETAGTGTRSRPLFCISENGTVLKHMGCSLEKADLPHTRQPCSHEGCQASWVTSNWTKCSVACGGRGVSKREVECVWRSNGQSTDAQNCADIIRPTDTRPCYTLPCTTSDCRDESQYCGIVLQARLCDYSQYRHQCCHSCSLSLTAGSSHRQQLQLPASSAHHSHKQPHLHGSTQQQLPQHSSRTRARDNKRRRRRFKRRPTHSHGKK